MKTSKSDKVKLIATIAVIEGEGNPGHMIAIINKLLEGLRSKSQTCKRDSPTPYQTT
jgi:hypothetical protein